VNGDSTLAWWKDTRSGDEGNDATDALYVVQVRVSLSYVLSSVLQL
jgi:hypothetical protein